MAARTGEISLDVAWAWDGIPPRPPVAMMNVYNGSARPSRAAVDSWGVPTLMGFESAVDRAFAGGDAGEADANFSIGRFAEWGYPLEAGSWCCAHDGNGTPSWALGNIEDYAFRYARRMVAAGRTGPIAGYGNPAAVEAFRRGCARAGVESPRWGVGTWGYGEGGYANAAPAFADCEQLQSGNTPGMYAGTDHNWLYAPVSVFRPYGLVVDDEPVPAPTGDDDVTYLETRADGTKAYWKLGLGDYFEIPEAVALGEQINGHGPPVPISTIQRIVMGRAAHDQAAAFLGTLDLGGGGGGGEVPPPVDLDPVRDALTAAASALQAAIATLP
jgi:hypothetical protein